MKRSRVKSVFFTEHMSYINKGKHKFKVKDHTRKATDFTLPWAG